MLTWLATESLLLTGSSQSCGQVTSELIVSRPHPLIMHDLDVKEALHECSPDIIEKYDDTQSWYSGNQKAHKDIGELTQFLTQYLHPSNEWKGGTVTLLLWRTSSSISWSMRSTGSSVLAEWFNWVKRKRFWMDSLHLISLVQ